jgi:hypothetical protein
MLSFWTWQAWEHAGHHRRGPVVHQNRVVLPAIRIHTVHHLARPADGARCVLGVNWLRYYYGIMQTKDMPGNMGHTVNLGCRFRQYVRQYEAPTFFYVLDIQEVSNFRLIPSGITKEEAASLAVMRPFC